MKYSRQREMIYQTIVDNPVHPTADEVYTQLKKHNPSLSLGTVYRNLNALSEIGKLRRIPVPYGAERFDGTVDEHLHLQCTSCGRLVDVPMSQPQRLDKIIESETGVSGITGYSLLLFGKCPDCQGKKQTKI